MQISKAKIIGIDRSMPAGKQDERRQGRYAVQMDYPVVVTNLNRSFFNSSIQAKIKDISDDGIGLSFREELSVGAKISLEILFHGCRFSVSGEIVHRRPFRDFYLYGIKIDGPAKALRKFIIAYESDDD
jgi:hypothetical protein